MTGPQGKRKAEIKTQYDWADWIYTDLLDQMYLFLVPQNKGEINLKNATYLRMTKDARIHHIVKGEVRTWNCTDADIETILSKYDKLQTFK